jgi:hypothetical protein
MATRSYDASGERVDLCPAEVSDDETVADPLTHLLWQRVQNCDLNWYLARDYCEALDYAGFDDWTLPQPHEVFSLLDYAQEDGWDAATFPGSVATWASEYDSERAWRPHVKYVYKYDKMDKGCVRCVRSRRSFGEPGSGARFLVVAVEGGATPTLDRVTGLMWDGGYHPHEQWSEALAWCEDSDYGGFDDWRLPDRNELASLIDYSLVDPASEIVGSHGAWSSTHPPVTTTTACGQSGINIETTGPPSFR